MTSSPWWGRKVPKSVLVLHNFELKGYFIIMHVESSRFPCKTWSVIFKGATLEGRSMLWSWYCQFQLDWSHEYPYEWVHTRKLLFGTTISRASITSFIWGALSLPGLLSDWTVVSSPVRNCDQWSWLSTKSELVKDLKLVREHLRTTRDCLRSFIVGNLTVLTHSDVCITDIALWSIWMADQTSPKPSPTWR